jgi:hypothetical protein
MRHIETERYRFPFGLNNTRLLGSTVVDDSYCMGSTPSSEGSGRGVKEAVSSKISS